MARTNEAGEDIVWLRIPVALGKQLRKIARREDLTISALIRRYCAQGVANDELKAAS